MPSAVITMKRGELIQTPRDLISLKEAEIKEGERVIAELSKIVDLSPSKLARVKGRVSFLRNFVELLKDGFIPIPRMEFEPITQMGRQVFKGTNIPAPTIVIDKLPVEAITTIAEYQDKFHRFGVVRPRGRGLKRDPFLIGIIRYGVYEEQFVLGWWRPDVMKPTELW